jgi:hypothetical protein
MLSRSRALELQRMTPGERFEIAMKLQDEAWAALEALPPDEFARRWKGIRADHDEFWDLVLAHLEKNDRPRDPGSGP